MSKYTLVGTIVLFFLLVTTALIISSRDTAKPVSIIKADKLTADLPLPAKPVKPVRIAAADDIPRTDIMVPEPEAPPEHELLEQNQPADTLPALRPRDICQRSGGKKIVTNHGRGWRCVYARR
jgi:hypothetical protein